MTQREIEIILARNLAEHLATPFFIVDPQGNLLFYNETAGDVLGYQFDVTGPMPLNQWATMFHPFDSSGNPLPPDELPLVITLKTRLPAHKNFWIRGFDGTLREIEVTAFPLIGQTHRFIGAAAVFWERLP
jgi:PAS domain-containing protein